MGEKRITYHFGENRGRQQNLENQDFEVDLSHENALDLKAARFFIHSKVKLWAADLEKSRRKHNRNVNRIEPSYEKIISDLELLKIGLKAANTFAKITLIICRINACIALYKYIYPNKLDLEKFEDLLKTAKEKSIELFNQKNARNT